MTEWFSVKDKLPEKSGHYLCYIEWDYGGTFIAQGHFNADRKRWAIDNEYVSYWAKLPNKPEGK